MYKRIDEDETEWKQKRELQVAVEKTAALRGWLNNQANTRAALSDRINSYAEEDHDMILLRPRSGHMQLQLFSMSVRK